MPPLVLTAVFQDQDDRVLQQWKSLAPGPEAPPDQWRKLSGPRPSLHPAVKTFSAAPDYLEAARLAGLSGTVIVEAEIDPAGSVASTRVLRGVSPDLYEAAREAVGRWRFEPATSNGRQPAPWCRRVTQRVLSSSYGFVGCPQSEARP